MANGTGSMGDRQRPLDRPQQVFSTHRQALREDFYGLTVRFLSIDVLTTGFKKKDLIILAARPSMGRPLALNFAVNVQAQYPRVDFQFGMDDEQSAIEWSASFSLPNGKAHFAFDYNTKLGKKISSRPRASSANCMTCP